MITVYLSHGLESGPGAFKVQTMKTLVEAHDECAAVVMDYRGMAEPEERLAHLLDTLASRHDDPARCIMVGSSLGGWVSAALSSTHPVLGCFLLAPAIGLPRYPQSCPRLQAEHSHIVHGWRDDVIPVDGVIDYARTQRLSLRLVDDDHRLHLSMPTILQDLGAFLDVCHSKALPLKDDL
ncbi:YqiA/YcfP family alpha/beta fold hydrolase [Halomonas sp. Bachu 37]|uniref:YqiA/YcfP family alpha/beta fold hydrolase n=1 Tax=Halomonas kashgarensis TaxID=3084920 RepID=UPI0032164384